MIIATLILFAVAAVFGIVLLSKLLTKKNLPRPVVYVHGLLAATGLVLLLLYAFQNPESYPLVSIIIFAVAALGGFILFYNDTQKKPGPVALAVIHGLAAVTAFVLLLLFVLGGA